jgi:hypothetical protein
MYIPIPKNYEIPTVEAQKTYPEQYVIKLVDVADEEEKNKTKLKLNKDAKKLLDHIEMVKKARKLYTEGKVITWEEFVSNER